MKNTFSIQSLGDGMDGPLIKAQHYHDQAKRMRELAAQEDNNEARIALVQLADSYDRLSNKFMIEATSVLHPRK
jgi:hypothetical protein